MSVKRIKSYLRVVTLSFEMTLRSNFVDSFVWFGVLVQPLIIALLAFWMLRDKGSEYIIFVVVGSGMTGLWSTLVFVSGNSVTQERWTGTLELLVGSPTPIELVMFGKNLANILQSLVSMLFSYLLAILIFGELPSIAQPALFFPALALAVLSYVCFGLVISPIFVMNPDAQHLQNGMEFPVFILSGFLFPIALLPGWTTPLSYILSPYWAARALHAASSGGAGRAEILLSWGMMALFSLLYIWLARWLFRRLLHKARVEATLSAQ